MANVIKKAVFNLIEKAIIDEGKVLEIRRWEPATMVEMVLYLPGVDMTGWKYIPRLKCKVGEFEYRDYSPATWDVGKKQCTMLVETGHKGFGSAWAQQLRVGDTIQFSPASTVSLPSSDGNVLGLGDGSALGHFMALKQMISPERCPLDVYVYLSEAYTLPASLLAEHGGFNFMMKPHADAGELLLNSIRGRNLSAYSSVYIAGHIPMVQKVRKALKATSGFRGKVFANGFWS
ncbi:SIP domain-containing protein [Dawidia soli]|uniref:Siderophore-interacting protein n=1 Tax=Dawidia soli TaxID=2782352 RepID=A0AAP2GD79_9BACT|nr:siderophore-interacting protein [Dawidia soli]MBT1687079.1 siderophore-interacting protein [Dawidia soli]